MAERYRRNENDDRGAVRRLWGQLLIAVATVSGSKHWKRDLKQKYDR